MKSYNDFTLFKFIIIFSNLILESKIIKCLVFFIFICIQLKLINPVLLKDRNDENLIEMS